MRSASMHRCRRVLSCHGDPSENGEQRNANAVCDGNVKVERRCMMLMRYRACAIHSMLTGSLTRSCVESMATTASAKKLETAEARLGVDSLRQPRLRANCR
jgi:hypothetical protein